MSQSRNNHYVPQWYQSGFFEERESQLCHLKRRDIQLKDGSTKVVFGRNWFTSAQCFYEKDLYSTFFGSFVNDDIERKLFGPIDDGGAVENQDTHRLKAPLRGGKTKTPTV